MKPKLNNVRLLFSCLLVLIIPGLSSCSKGGKGSDVEIVKVPASLKQMLPYNDGQTITFVNGTGHTINATVQLRVNWSDVSPCAGCAVTKKIEYYEYKFLVGTSTFIFISIDNRPIIFTSIYSPVDNYTIGAVFDFWAEDAVPQPQCGGPRQICVPAVTLNGTTFTNVVEISSGATQPHQLVKAYYTVAKGLFAFSYGNGMTYLRM